MRRGRIPRTLCLSQAAVLHAFVLISLVCGSQAFSTFFPSIQRQDRALKSFGNLRLQPSKVHNLCKYLISNAIFDGAARHPPSFQSRRVWCKPVYREQIRPAVAKPLLCTEGSNLNEQDLAEISEPTTKSIALKGKGLPDLPLPTSFLNGLVDAIRDREFDAAIFALAIPALGSLIIEPGVRTVEAVMVGRLGAARLGALSIGGSIVSVSFPVFNFFSYATTPMVARALAKGDTNEASRLVAQGIWLSTVVGCLLGSAMLIYSDGILRTMGANQEIWPFAKAFLMIRALAAPAELWLLVAKGASYGHQNTKAPLAAVTIGSCLHLILDVLLISVMGMDVAGAALAVVISQYTAAIFLLTFLVRDGILKMSDLGRMPDLSKIVTYLTAGRSLLIRTVSMQGFYTVMTGYGARMGTAVIAAHAIARQCASLESLVVDGLAVAAQALVAMYIGQLPAALAYILDGISLGARDFQFLGVAMFWCIIPALGVLISTAALTDLGLCTLWLASGTLIIARVITLAYRFNSRHGPLSPTRDTPPPPLTPA